MGLGPSVARRVVMLRDVERRSVHCSILAYRRQLGLSKYLFLRSPISASSTRPRPHSPAPACLVLASIPRPHSPRRSLNNEEAPYFEVLVRLAVCRQMERRVRESEVHAACVSSFVCAPTNEGLRCTMLRSPDATHANDNKRIHWPVISRFWTLFAVCWLLTCSDSALN